LLAGIFAGRAGARALVLERRTKLGAKIRVSGGGRCNLLPSEASVRDFHTSGSTRALRNVLRAWPLGEVRAFFESDLGIPLKVEPTGKVFPVSERPGDVVGALCAALGRVGGEVRAASHVRSVQPAPGGVTLRIDGAGDLAAARVILATGGLSLPRSGSDGDGLAIARALGHRLAPTFPVLVPLTTADPEWLALPGLSVRVTLRARRGPATIASRSGSLLFTHRGFSGPVVLDLSRELTAPGAQAVALFAHWGGEDTPWPALLRRAGPGTVSGVLRGVLPRRLADLLLERARVAADRRTAELPRPERAALERELTECALPVDGNEGYRTAEATGGGVRLRDLHTGTLESRIAPGLHFAGEMIDVDGRIGGYNFLWAFVSGRRAGEAAGLRAPRQNG